MQGIEAMYAYFGKDRAHKCGQCGNHASCSSGNYCMRYGKPKKGNSNWSAGKTACGAFDRPLTVGETPLEKRLVAGAADKPQLDGQVSLFEGGGG